MVNKKFYISKLESLGIKTYAMKSINDMDKNELKTIYERQSKIKYCPGCKIKHPMYPVTNEDNGKIKWYWCYTKNEPYPNIK